MKRRKLSPGKYGYAVLLCLLAFCNFNLFSQNLYQPLTGPNVQVGTVSNNGGLCINDLCLGPGYRDLSKVVDGNLTTYSSLSNFANILNFSGVSVRDYGHVFPAGYVAGYLFSSQSILNLDVLNKFIVSTYKNGVLQESKSAGGLLGANVITNDAEQVYLTFITTKDFDEIRFRMIGVSIDVLTGLKIYSAFAFPSTPVHHVPAINACNRPIGGTATRVNFNSEGVCAACTLSDSKRIIDGNGNNYASMAVTASLLSAPSVGVMNTATVYPAGYRAGFVISPNSGNSLAYISLLNSVTVETYLFGEKQEEVSTNFNSGGGLLSLKLLTFGAEQRNKIGFTTSKPFNEIRFKVDPGAHVSVGAIRVYYAFAEPETCTDCRVYLGSETAGKYKGELVGNSLFSIYTGTYGLGAHSLDIPYNAVSASTQDHATYNALLQLLGAGARVTVKNDGTLFAAGTQAGFDIVQEGGILNLALLDNIVIRTYNINGSTKTLQEEKLNGLSLLALTVIGDNAQRASIGFKTTKPFNAIQVDISGGLVGLGLGGRTKIYGAFIFEDADNDGYGDCIDICPLGDDSIDSDNDGIPDACDFCQAGNIPPDLPVAHLENNCNAANQLEVILPRPMSMVPNTTFQYHSAVPPGATNKLSSSTISGIGHYTFYGVYYDSIQDCYSPEMPITVTINPCILPDLVPNIIYGSNIVEGYDTLNIGFEIKNLNGAPTTGPISVTIDKNPNRTIFQPYDATRTAITVYDAQQNPTTHIINNTDWTVTYSSYSITMETNQVIPAFGSSKVGFTIRQNPNNFNNDIVTVRIAPYSGGEDVTHNNTQSLVILYEYGNGPLPFSRPLSTDNHTATDGKGMYPNPSNSEVYLDDLKGEENITVVNILGQTIFRTKATSGKFKLDVQDYTAGTYSVMVTDKEGNTRVYKLIKVD